jgi:hypothetical protein
LDALKEGGADMALENAAGLTAADIMLKTHSIKYDGPRGSGASVAGGNTESKGEAANDDDDDDDGKSKKKDKKSKKKEKKSKKSKKADKDEAAKRKLAESAEAAEVANSLFSKFDLDDNNILDVPEFLNCLKSLGFKDLFPGDHFKHKVRECFKQFDKDGSGGISRDEFQVFHNWLKAEHGVSATVEDAGGGQTKIKKQTSTSKLQKQKSSRQEDEVEAAELDKHVDTYVLVRDPKVDFGMTFKVASFGDTASKKHHLLKDGREYLVVRTLRNLPDGSLGPATLQGLEENDIVLHLDGKEVATFADWAARTKGCNQIKVTLLRLPDSGGGLMGRSHHSRMASWGAKGLAATTFHANPLKPNGGIDTGFLPSIAGR